MPSPMRSTLASRIDAMHVPLTSLLRARPSLSVLLTLVLVTLTTVTRDAEARTSVDPRGQLTVRILHTNDMHARFLPINQGSNICSESQAQQHKCYGGFARIATLVRDARDRQRSADGVPTLFLNAGDTYQGSELFTLFHWKIVSRFLNILAPDVISLGNHEFDDGVEGLVPYLKNASYPIIAANLDWSNEPSLENTVLKKSHILEINGIRIGVIGYLTQETQVSSKPGKIIFYDEVNSIRQEAKKLKESGINILIALGHSGFKIDREIASAVEDIDLVIGGHTNTFLYTGNEPDVERKEGDYPFVVVQPKTGRKVYVVQAYAHTKYLGDLSITFDKSGEVISIAGNPILVNSNIPEALDVVEELSKWTKNIINKDIGKTKVLLDGNDKACRVRECNFGNLVTDSIIHYHVENYNSDAGWTDAPIALINSGSIRSSIDRGNQDKVTKSDIVTAFPFKSTIEIVKLKGSILRKVFEQSVIDMISENMTNHGGGFLQVSGVKVVYDLSKPVGERVVSIQTRCGLCNVPTYQDFDENRNYTILTTDFMTSGGDGYKILKDLPRINLNVTMAQVVEHYINQTSPVYPDVQGRIQFKAYTDSDISSNSNVIHNNYFLPTVFLSLLFISVEKYFSNRV